MHRSGLFDTKDGNRFNGVALALIFTHKTLFCAIFSIVVSNFVGEAEFFL